MLKLFYVSMWWIDDRNKGKGANLAIKEVAPRIRGDFLAKRFKVPKTGHRLRVDCDVAKGDRLDNNSRTSWC